ncbi:hypothetical protein B7P34_05625 [Streptosporangium nondiastaticum]|uniref:8-amino-7-oxononanoate synthase n=1 Tax=Streptosporangium nondiastaticum TaxID=35764 RepID=A0A9X7JTP0_9ACTN|nr:aminotransferase class I/II-fold pyridoxal phosphate-dependent enzyme [Streptosporangium nondiastaticum]PSJ29733.1 hypothetical protein B7P34_05625 [Streptosporangium nondiastaticum]
MTTTDFGAVHNSVLELTDRLRKTDAYPLFPVVAQAGPTRARVRAAGCATERDVTVLASADYLGVLGTLAGPGDVVFLDRFDHGSITMGARLSGAGVRMFRHNDAAHLEALLSSGEAREARRRLVVVDGLFGADGDLPPLREIADLAQFHQALLIVDEAHSAGALGARGCAAAARRHGCTLRSRAATGRSDDRRSSGRGAVNGE